MLREERKRTENETSRNHTVQIEQLEAKARLKNEMQERVVKEQGMRQEREINQLKEMTRLEKEEHERQWERKKNDMNLKLTNSRKEQSWSPRRWKNSGKIRNNEKGSERKNDSNGKENGARKTYLHCF